jgi:hypothetical protein
MNDKVKKAFEKWYNLPADQTLNDPILYRQFLDDTLPDHTKTFCEKAWEAACKYMRNRSPLDSVSLYDKLEKERERSEILVEALEKIQDYAHDRLDRELEIIVWKALKEYRGEV